MANGLWRGEGRPSAAVTAASPEETALATPYQTPPSICIQGWRKVAIWDMAMAFSSCAAIYRQITALDLDEIFSYQTTKEVRCSTVASAPSNAINSRA